MIPMLDGAGFGIRLTEVLYHVFGRRVGSWCDEGVKPRAGFRNLSRVPGRVAALCPKVGLAEVVGVEVEVAEDEVLLEAVDDSVQTEPGAGWVGVGVGDDGQSAAVVAFREGVLIAAAVGVGGEVAFVLPDGGGEVVVAFEVSEVDDEVAVVIEFGSARITPTKSGMFRESSWRTMRGLIEEIAHESDVIRSEA